MHLTCDSKEANPTVVGHQIFKKINMYRRKFTPVLEDESGRENLSFNFQENNTDRYGRKIHSSSDEDTGDPEQEIEATTGISDDSDNDYDTDNRYGLDSLIDEIHLSETDKNTVSEDTSDYSDGISEDSASESDDINILITEKEMFAKDDLKVHLKNSAICRSNKSFEELPNKSNVKPHFRKFTDENLEKMSNSKTKDIFPATVSTDKSSRELEYDSLTAKDNTFKDKEMHKIVFGNCQTPVNSKQSTSSKSNMVGSDQTASLVCQYCLQDEKQVEAITYCMDCGLYMCGSCRRYHHKFVATRGHSVAVQQELIPSEFGQYRPSTVETNEITRDGVTSPLLDNYSQLLDTDLVDAGRYSRSLAPTDNSLCGPCLSETIEEQATHYCQDCGDYMCQLCYQFHQKLQTSYDQHSVIHQRGCKDFDTFVPRIDQQTMDENKEAETFKVESEAKGIGLLKIHDNNFMAMLQPMGRFSTKLTSDPYECSVTGIDCFSDGRIVLIDGNNRNVKLYSSGYQALDNLELPHQPADVTIVTNQKVVVSCPHESKLAFVGINQGGLSLLRIEKTASKYVRITSKCEEIYALCNPEGEGQLWLYILNENGKILSFIHLDVTQNEIPLTPQVPSITVSPAGGTVYISDKNHCVSAFGLDGRRIFKHENLNMFDISDLVADSTNIYVCCKTLHSIFRMSYDGRDSNVVVHKTARIASPRTVAIKGNLLLVGLCDSDSIHIYSLARQ